MRPMALERPAPKTGEHLRPALRLFRLRSRSPSASAQTASPRIGQASSIIPTCADTRTAPQPIAATLPSQTTFPKVDTGLKDLPDFPYPYVNAALAWGDAVYLFDKRFGEACAMKTTMLRRMRYIRISSDAHSASRCMNLRQPKSCARETNSSG